MRTNIMLDENLVAEAMKLSNIKTKKDVIHEALVEYVKNKKKKDISELKGKILFEEGYDYKVMREEK